MCRAPAPEISSIDLKRDNCDLSVSRPSLRTIQIWYKNIQDGCFNVMKTSTSRTSSVVIGNIQPSGPLLECKVEREPHLSCQDITDNHFLYKTTVRMVIKRYLDCWNDLSAWVPFNLTDAIKDLQMRCFRELLSLSTTMG